MIVPAVNFNEKSTVAALTIYQVRMMFQMML